MNKRKLLIALLVAGLFSAGLGMGVFPASADQRTFVVTLVTGQQVTVTMDVPPGTPLDQIHPPGIDTPIASIVEVTPPADAPPVALGTATTPTSSTTPSEAPPAADQGQDATPVASGQTGEQTTGHKTHNSKAQVETDAGALKVVKHLAKDKSKIRNPDGTPTNDNPTFSFALPGPAPIGVPNFFIEKFRIPPFLLPIYQAAGIQYGVRWEVLAAINEIETDYGRNLNISSAGAVGWMQFMPSTWKRYGVDANNDKVKDPYNPVDAIFAAARYLKAAGADKDIRKAVFAYNHASWYVDSVLLRARLIGGLPTDLVSSLTGLTQGHFPVHAKARYADDVAEAASAHRINKGTNAALPVTSDTRRTGIDIFAKAGSPVVAVQDGKIVRMGTNNRFGHFIQLRDVYGNTYTYAHLKSLVRAYPVPKT